MYIFFKLLYDNILFTPYITFIFDKDINNIDNIDSMIIDIPIIGKVYLYMYRCEGMRCVFEYFFEED